MRIRLVGGVVLRRCWRGEGWRKWDWHWDDVGCLIGMVMRGGNGDFGVFVVSLLGRV